jgi:ribosome-binding factor A
MSRRVERVAERLRKDLATAINTLKHPEIGFVTVTGVRVSKDLRYADVQVSVLPTRGHEDPEDSLRALRHSSGFLQAQVGKNLRLRVTPELRFELDPLGGQSADVAALIREAREGDPDHVHGPGIHAGSEAAPPPGADAPGEDAPGEEDTSEEDAGEADLP